MMIANDLVVGIHYTLKNDTGETIDSSEGKDPLLYLHGKNNIIPGLENALLGKAVGDKLDVTVNPEEGYGSRNDELIQVVPKTEFEDADTIQVGVQFQAQTEQGPIILTVIEIKDAEFVLDGNHPLAGQTLIFSVEVTEVREATKDEMDHGHPHGPGGANH